MLSSNVPGGYSVRGRKPVPTRLKVLRGNPGKRPLPFAEPTPTAGAPSCPDHVTGAARAEWERIAPELLTAGLLTKIDRAALAGYCTAYGRWVEAETALRTHGVLVKSPSGFPMVSPYLTVANKALEQMVKLLTEFGGTPSSRSRVAAAPPAPKSRLARFIGGT